MAPGRRPVANRRTQLDCLAAQAPEASVSLIDHLRGMLEHAEAEVREAIELGKLESARPTCFKPMRACINMVYGNATALCAAFGLPQGAAWATHLDEVTMRVLDLYSPAKVDAAAREPGDTRSGKAWAAPLAKRMKARRLRRPDAICCPDAIMSICPCRLVCAPPPKPE